MIIFKILILTCLLTKSLSILLQNKLVDYYAVESTELTTTTKSMKNVQTLARSHKNHGKFRFKIQSSKNFKFDY